MAVNMVPGSEVGPGEGRIWASPGRHRTAAEVTLFEGIIRVCIVSSRCPNLRPVGPTVRDR